MICGGSSVGGRYRSFVRSPLEVNAGHLWRLKPGNLICWSIFLVVEGFLLLLFVGDGSSGRLGFFVWCPWNREKILNIGVFGVVDWIARDSGTSFNAAFAGRDR